MNIAKLLHRSQVSQHYNRLWYRVNVFLFIILFASLSSNLSVVLATNSPNSDPVETQRRQLGLKDRLSDWSSWGHERWLKQLSKLLADCKQLKLGQN